LVSRLREFAKDRSGVRVEFRSLVATEDASAVRVHEAALAAAEQGRFWEMVERLRKESTVPDAGRLDTLAGELKLDLSQFQTSIRSHQNHARILADSKEAGERGLQPGALVMNGTLFHGEPTVENLARHMDENACCGKAAGSDGSKRAREVTSKSPL
jgi:protein-disulfide isomerase